MKHLITVSLAVLSLSATAQTVHYNKTSCGTEYTLALRSDSTLWGFGMNQNRQLGNDSITMTDTAMSILPDTKWVEVAAGAFHTLAIDKDGKMWGWGLNAVGELGGGIVNDTGTLPTIVGGTQTWKAVSAGYLHSLAIRTDGTLWATGWNVFSQLGGGDTNTVFTWRQVGTDNNWSGISAGGAASYAIKTDGSLWGWGINMNGEIGLNNTSNSVVTPTRIGTANNWKSVSSGFEFVTALKTDGTLWSTGFNGNNNLGRTTSGLFDSVFAQINTDTNWSSVAAGSSFGLAIKTDGTLWGWGYNQYGQLGSGSTAMSQPLTQSGSENDWAFISCARGATSGSTVFGVHSAGLKTNATTICTTGGNYIGQLGNGHTSTAPQSNFDCSISQINPNGVADVAKNGELTLYPNPASNELFVTNTAKNSTYEINDMTGRSLLKGVVYQGAPIQLQLLMPGTYTIKIVSNGTATFKVFTKE